MKGSTEWTELTSGLDLDLEQLVTPIVLTFLLSALFICFN